MKLLENSREKLSKSEEQRYLAGILPYNAANYVIRQAFIHEGVYLNYNEMHALMKTHEAYKALPRKVSQHVLKTLHKNWLSFFAAMKAWKAHPEQFLGRPKLPGYKDKQHGRNLLVYTIQALSKPALARGLIVPSSLPITIQAEHTNVDQVRIVPRSGYYVVEIVYGQEIKQADVDPCLYAGIDIGIDNLATLTSNKVGFVPRIVNGRPLKSINQFYNKRKAELQSILKDTRFTARMERMITKRTRRIDHYLHTASRRIIDLLVSEGIGTLVIGKNPNWKQEVNMGKRNNQQFVNIPHAHIDLQSQTRWDRCHCHRGKLYQQVQFSRQGSDRQARSLLRKARQAWLVSGVCWPAHECRCERLLQHCEKSSS